MEGQAGDAEFLAGGGELGALMRGHDWESTPLGPVETWSHSLRAAVSIMLNSRFPIALYWGPELALLYNDDWSPIPGAKHPWALGRPGREVWPEIWDTIGPLYERVVSTGEGVWQEDELLPMHRHGYLEECYYNFTFSPVRGADGGIEGIFNAVVETTDRVLSERRLRTLSRMGERADPTLSVEDACRRAADILAQNAADVPFALVYLRDGDGVRLAATTGVEAGSPAAPATMPLAGSEAIWRLADIAQADMAAVIEPTEGLELPKPIWPEPVAQVMLVPVTVAGEDRPSAFLVAGVNPRRRIDEGYRSFYELAAGHIATVIAAARTYAEERRRAEALAEIDRAKTAFFSNVSHEFRTPLTLMLAPLEDLLAEAESLPEEHRERLDVAHRNSLRLLRLVNALLDFSRIEAGRVQARYQPTDLAALTADLAASFRSVTERAGIDLRIECSGLSDTVCVDRDMWEKIVLNLVSNAFKFTFAGEIVVTVDEADGRARLRVRDTGTGIPAQELPRLFERFHRVEGARGRSFEGSGIGLALVQELVKLHGGEIRVDSAVGIGTAFTVSIPFGARHLPQDRLASAEVMLPPVGRAQSFIEEAVRWLPGAATGDAMPEGRGDRASSSADDAGEARKGAERILVADDNADLQQYIVRLLRERGYAVEAVNDGQAALEAARARRPDILLTDVMMPRLDGFGLLHAVREDPGLRDMPVIMLSARAGEEAKVEGLDAGADDYLTKPFSARELVARVAANLAMARVRREAADEIRISEARAASVLEGMGEGYVRLDRDFRVLRINAEALRLEGRPAAEIIGKTHWEAWPGSEQSAQGRLYKEAMAQRIPVSLDATYSWPDGRQGWFEVRAYPLEDGLSIFYRDINDRKQAEARLREMNETLERRVEEEVAQRAKAEEALRQSQKMEAVGQLTGGIAHDFNNLLTIITGNMDMARRAIEASGSGDVRLRRAVDNAVKGAERAASLTQRLLAFSRRQPLAPKALHVDRLLSGMSDLLRHSLGEANRLEIVTAPGLWTVEADPNQLESAILNLAVNARDAMPGGGALTIETANARLDEEYSAEHAEVAPGNYVVIAVSDTGAGMPKETLARVFEPFFTTKEVGRGTGLGLSMVYGFVKQTGGHVKVYSEEGEGTTVKIYLPRLIGAQEEEAEIDRAYAMADNRGETILVVEDDDDVRAYSVELLRELGYRVLEAHDGPAAVRLLERRDIDVDLLFTDVVMPGMSGRELADAARVLRPGLKVLYTSGYTRNAIVHGGRLDPGVQMIPKPFTYQALSMKIRDLLDTGNTGRLLIVEDDPTVRLLSVELLAGAGYAVEEAANATEAMGKVRAAGGRYDAVVIDARLPDKRGELLVGEIRALHADLPVLVMSGEHAAALREQFGADRCTGILAKPYNAELLLAALREVGVRCMAG